MTTRTPGFLMANLGSEVARLYVACDRGDAEGIAQCRERALSITQALQRHPALAGRAGEVVMLEFLIREIAGLERTTDVSREDLEAYFYPFASRLLRQM